MQGPEIPAAARSWDPARTVACTAEGGGDGFSDKIIRPDKGSYSSSTRESTLRDRCAERRSPASPAGRTQRHPRGVRHPGEGGQEPPRRAGSARRKFVPSRPFPRPAAGAAPTGSVSSPKPLAKLDAANIDLKPFRYTRIGRFRPAPRPTWRRGIHTTWSPRAETESRLDALDQHAA